jgi:hypothetical protein
MCKFPKKWGTLLQKVPPLLKWITSISNSPRSLMLGKDLEQGCSWNSGSPLSSHLMPGPHSQNGPILNPYPTQKHSFGHTDLEEEASNWKKGLEMLAMSFALVKLAKHLQSFTCVTKQKIAPYCEYMLENVLLIGDHPKIYSHVKYYYYYYYPFRLLAIPKTSCTYKIQNVFVHHMYERECTKCVLVTPIY